ncbi:undecaprenyl-phosphate glucose phosphotransferase [Oharaeibacter diazotrophicus]|uniref:Undecaprenyl-phosphate glucose phosphotransferase n=1 Tax=Oharaeibacter diazotrophicus TaxID=1920512 RepID=A0A4R6RJG0_9HYPH|nr:undecaprenyl-phosphate glucose phosphotransferase [Oharaeibacter diazotrophicus]TDP86554.1 Undecaprenyl-phosphate glucose phosphotransferase [Oharaeibacter diazotrophicus]BBE71504.1 UDP-glucose:undecaprenyl-phosphate glucose-1-phosphate transferase [Pleomorphomonas sp. SM30]GLS78265.1 undecaprenyl-phosphate glucose phosphotransferase [Oharaeibacter diazotrophicus]
MSLQDTARHFPPLAPAEPPPAPVRAVPTRLGERARAVANAFHEAAIPPSLASGLVIVFETLCLILAGVAARLYWLGDAADFGLGSLGPVVGAPFLVALAVQTVGGYDLSMLRRPQVRVGRVLASWLVVFGAFAVTIVVGDFAPGVGRSWYPVWLGAGTVTLMAAATVSSMVIGSMTRAGRLQQRAVIVGGGALAEGLITALDDSGGNEIKILGIFDDRADDRSPENQKGYPKLGTIGDLVEFARVAAVDLVIVSLPMSAETRLLQVLKQLWVLPVDIRLAAHANKLRLRPRSYSYVGTVPFLDVFDKPISGWDSVVKRVFDLVFGTLAIVTLSPVMLATAVAIKLDSPGPVLFRQKRYGFNNEVIEVLKFRSMYADKADPSAKVVVTKGDPRVTRVGRFIRRTSIDELPQFFNVLRGQLSLVGPRPHAVNAHTSQRLWEEVVDGYFARHKVKPGVTGWAQISGLRGEVDSPSKIQARVEHDLAYIENWSVLFDLYILMMTPIRILNQENAY